MVHTVGYDTMGYMGLFEQPVLRSATQGGYVECTSKQDFTVLSVETPPNWP